MMSARGFTLVEMIVAIVVAAILATVIASFVTVPIRASVDVARRAELTDVADTALRRFERDLHRALPNSVRVTVGGGVTYVEYLEVRTGGRYRAEPSGVATDANSCSDAIAGGGDNDGLANEDVLSFGVADVCFRSIGAIAELANIAAGNDWLVVYNLGTGYANADAYASGNVTGGNKSLINSAVAAAAAENRVSFQSHSFSLPSPGNRFHIVSGPVTYECNPLTGELRRHSGYAIQITQPVSFAGTPALLASGVSACSIAYTSGAAERSALVAISLTLSKDGEGVTLYHETQVSNVP
jgi:MSHA biogenesis protein MshO